MSKPFSPHAEMTAYKKAVEDRGYDSFSKDSHNAWHEKHGHVAPADIHSISDFFAKDFLASLSDPSNTDRLTNRQRFKNEFDADEEKVKQHFRNEINLKNGLKYKGNHGLHRELGYEKRMTDVKQPLNTGGGGEAELLKNLMHSRWQAQGYTEAPGHADNDSAYLNKFYDEYCVALQKPNHIANGAGAIYGPDGPGKAAKAMQGIMNKLNVGAE